MDLTESVQKKFMKECLRLAEKGRGSVSPNPLVGAVLVKGGRIVGRGFHAQFGGPHAEVECLRSFHGDPHSATLYVNLEPCAHYGKTPPCTDLIIRSGIRRVVIGMKDPNPLVAGRGIRKLRSAGVRVVTGILEPEARDLNRAFVTNMTKKRPFVHMKIAQTLDGKIAFGDHSPTQITGREARSLVHKWRSEHDAVLVGAGTILADDPQLTVRMVKGRNPSVVLLDGKLSVNPASRIFNAKGGRQVIVLTTRKGQRRHPKKYKKLELAGAQMYVVKSKTSSIELMKILGRLYKSHIGSILVEGGSEVFTQFLNEGVVDRLSLMIAPKLLADDGLPVVSGTRFKGRLASTTLTSQRIGQDVLVDFIF